MADDNASAHGSEPVPNGIIFDSSDSSYDRSRATSPASTSDNASDNIGCIPEEVEEPSDDEAKDAGLEDDKIDADEAKDAGLEDEKIDVDEAKDAENKVDEAKDAENKVDEARDVELVYDQTNGGDQFDIGDDEKFVTQPVSSSTADRADIDRHNCPPPISPYSSRNTDMDLLKAILHDESVGDNVIPEEPEETSDADDDAKKSNDDEPEQPTVSSNFAPMPEQSNSENPPESTNNNEIDNAVVDEADNKEEPEHSGNESEQRPAEPEQSPTEPIGKKRRKKQSIKKKKQQPPLVPVAPWSRASINSVSRPPQQQQPLASDRSTSVATGVSVGGGSRGSRALSMSAKELREKYRPISNQEKMAQRLNEIDSLLARDYANEARLAYQRSVAECRQAWQNYATTARIMGHVTDQADEQHEQHQQQQQQMSSRAQSRVDFYEQQQQEEEAASLRRNHRLGGRVAPELGSAASQSHPQPRRHKAAADDEAADDREQEPEQENELPEQQEPELTQLEQEPEMDDQLHGYRVGAPQRMAGRFGSDNKLSESNNPDVRAWLREKNRAERRQRRETRDAKRREMQARLDAQQRQSERRQEAEEAFQYWSKRKHQQQQVKPDKDEKSVDNKAGQRQLPVQEPLPLSDQEAAFAALENRPRQGGPRPSGSAKPVHNSVFKRSPALLGTSGASFSGRQVRMGIIGQPVRSETTPARHHDQLAIEQQHQTQSEVRLSFDDWSQRKSEQLAARRRQEREAERQQREAAAAADPQMSALVPQLARRRIRTATESKQRRTDTGLGLARPRTAVPALAPPSGAATAPQMNPPRRQSARASSSRARTSSLERREAAITSELPNPFVAPTEDAMLERILAPAGNGAV